MYIGMYRCNKQSRYLKSVYMNALTDEKRFYFKHNITVDGFVKYLSD